MTDFVQEATQNLLRLHKKTKICRPQTDLCVEGFPRSANTFCVDFLAYLCRTENLQLNFAHHTHSPLNVELAIKLEKPCLVLIREPVSAITSFAIYSGARISAVAQRYLEFYKDINTWSPAILIADFDVIVANINIVIAKLNQQYCMQIPLSLDLKKDSEHVSMLAKTRARKRHSKDPGLLIRNVGSPNPEREKLKEKTRPEVVKYLSSEKELLHRYESIRQLESYVA